MRRLWRCAGVLAASALLAGCATYSPIPIGADTAAVLAGPTPMQVRAASAKLDHPALPARVVDLAKPLDELDLAVLAVVANPELRALRAQADVAEAEVFAAGLFPDPQFGFSLDRPFDTSLVDAFNLTLGLDLAALAARPSLKAKAQASAHQMRYDLAWREWLVANQARTLYRRLDYLGQQQALAQRAAERARELAAVTRRALDQGNAKLDEYALRQVALLDGSDRQLALERQLLAARLALKALLGLAPEQDLALAPAPASAPAPALDAQALFATAAARRLDLTGLRSAYEAHAAELKHAIVGQYPLPVFSATRARDTSDINTRGGGVALTLPLWNRNRGAIAVAEATRAQLRADYAARLQQTRADIIALVADLAALARERQALAGALPDLSAALDTLRAAAERHDVPLVNFETARASLLDKQLAALALAQAQAEAEVALDTATGVMAWHNP